MPSPLSVPFSILRLGILLLGLGVKEGLRDESERGFWSRGDKGCGIRAEWFRSTLCCTTVTTFISLSSGVTFLEIVDLSFLRSVEPRALCIARPVPSFLNVFPCSSKSWPVPTLVAWKPSISSSLSLSDEFNWVPLTPLRWILWNCRFESPLR